VVEDIHEVLKHFNLRHAIEVPPPHRPLIHYTAMDPETPLALCALEM
jgi:hypothetical protein